MDKFLCACGMGFKTKISADLHLKLNKNGPEGWPHQIVKMHWRSRLIWWFFDLPWPKIFKIIGIYILFGVLSKHFHGEFDLAESLLIGLGIGLIL